MQNPSFLLCFCCFSRENVVDMTTNHYNEKNEQNSQKSEDEPDILLTALPVRLRTDLSSKLVLFFLKIIHLLTVANIFIMLIFAIR